MVEDSLECAAPFRLDLTVAALRRLPENPVECWDGGRYVRAFETSSGTVAWVVAQEPRRPRLRVELHGPVRDPGPWLGLLRRMLGTDLEVARFLERARASPAPAVRALAARFAGVRPPRFASLWEAFAATVLFQQLSLGSAMAALRRLVHRFSAERAVAGERLRPFPPAEAIAAAPEATLRGLGLSGAKAAALASAARAIAAGELREAELERLPTPALRERLLLVRGVGPWTADLILLRGFRRLEVFPGGDAAASRGLDALLGGAPAAPILEALGDVRGMLYFHFLLQSLAAKGLVAAATA